ncbi:unnamed protein product [Durusdinium trenchii]|uniref:Cytochrome-b5 reductase n=1 Tax=Durusdinium trenchii TaxID=1381693 RepID=A0ABP0JL50_9DINO
MYGKMDSGMDGMSDLSEVLPLKFSQRGCLGLCGQGPNSLLENMPAKAGKPGNQAVNRLDSFSKVLAMVKKFLRAQGAEFAVPEEVLTRARFKSDAMRLLSKSPFRPQHTLDDMQGAIESLSKALDMEDRLIHGSGAITTDRHLSRSRVFDLLLLRGKAWGRLCLAKLNSDTDVEALVTAALHDFGRALLEKPRSFEALVEAAHIYAFSGQTTRAVEFYEKAIDLMKTSGTTHESARLQRRVERLKAGGSIEVDTGDGSGLWKVEEITGVTADTCVYHLRLGRSPGNPHPYPESAWHIQVFLGSTVREYTPISSVSDWEDGSLDLLVKTYPDGTVSRFFGTLRTVQEARDLALQNYAPLEEQNCWVRVSAPLLTLQLPSFSEGGKIVGPVEDLGIIAGGTGIAPALQILSECLPGKSLNCRAVLLYSSRSLQDILMLDELRAIQEASAGQVRVVHTLTAVKDVLQRLQTRCYFSGRHGHFLEDHRPDPPQELLLGHINRDMLRKVMPPRGRQVRILISGHLDFFDQAVAILVIYVFDVFIADAVSDYLPVHGKEFHVSTCLMVLVIVLTVISYTLAPSRSKSA